MLEGSWQDFGLSLTHSVRQISSLNHYMYLKVIYDEPVNKVQVPY